MIRSRFLSLACTNLALTLFALVGAFASKPSDSVLFPVCLIIIMGSLLGAFLLSTYGMSIYRKAGRSEQKQWRSAVLIASMPIAINLVGMIVLRNFVPPPAATEVGVDREV